MCRYRAVVTGSLCADSGAILTPVHGKDSLTRFETIKREFRENIPGWVTVVDLWPHTGRKHQLRIHMASLGHPIIGEELYQDDPNIPSDLVFDSWLARGLYLWAVEIAFRHPITGEDMHFCIDAPVKFDEVIGRKSGKKRERVGLRAVRDIHTVALQGMKPLGSTI